MEQATLTINRKLLSKEGIFKELFGEHKKGNSFEKVIEKETEFPHVFGSIRFVEKEGSVFYEHLPTDETLSQQQLQCLMDIPPEWLFCFKFNEMRVVGLDMGVFEAETTVALALERLRWVDVDASHELFHKRREIYVWLQNNARSEDRIRLCSEWIYYHPESKYDYAFVQGDINRRISLLKSQLSCSHWTKNAS